MFIFESTENVEYNENKNDVVGGTISIPDAIPRFGESAETFPIEAGKETASPGKENAALKIAKQKAAEIIKNVIARDKKL